MLSLDANAEMLSPQSDVWYNLPTKSWSYSPSVRKKMERVKGEWYDNTYVSHHSFTVQFNKYISQEVLYPSKP